VRLAVPLTTQYCTVTRTGMAGPYIVPLEELVRLTGSECPLRPVMEFWPKFATETRCDVPPEPDTGDTAKPQAAATEAPAAMDATTAARIGERCSAGAPGETVGTGSYEGADGIRNPMGGSGIRGPLCEGASSAGGAEASPMSEERRLIGTPVSERSDATIRRSWSAAARHIVQYTTWRS
jgi:hypothetical protein